MRRIETYFVCEDPRCSREVDRGYEIRRKGKKIKLCEECYNKIRRKESGVSENIHA